jgi:hypothetical protein
LAIIYVEKDSSPYFAPTRANILALKSLRLDNFLVERVLAKMQDKDTELVRMKQLTQDKMFGYNIIRETTISARLSSATLTKTGLKNLNPVSAGRWKDV